MSETTAVFTGARVFDGEGFQTGVDVVIAGSEVREVGPSLAASEPAATVIDASGRTILPGIIDLHVHFVAEGAGSMHEFMEPFSMQFYASTARMLRTLQAGVTTVRDAGGTDLGAKLAQERGIVPGPRMRIAVSVMGQSGGHSDGLLPSGATTPLMMPHPGRPSGVADGIEEVRKRTREILRAGADQIKICSTGGVLSPGDDPKHSQFSTDEIRVIVEEAAAQGTYVMAHAQGAEGIKNALTAGVRSIEHGIYLDDDTIGLFLEHNAVLVPTLVAPLAVVAKAKQQGSGLPQVVVDKALAVVDIHRASVARAAQAGVRIGMGTDSGVGIHGENLQELAELADIGMDLEAVLAASTSVAGSLIGGAKVGRLAPGFAADLLLIEGELTEAAQLRGLRSRIRQVWQAGALVHSAERA